MFLLVTITYYIFEAQGQILFLKDILDTEMGRLMVDDGTNFPEL